MPVLIKMIKNEIFQELPKCDTEIRNEQMLPEKNVTVELLYSGLLQIFNCLKICITREGNKMKHACNSNEFALGR